MAMNRYSIFSLAKGAFGGHRAWTRAWRSPEPKAEYDVIIIGGGGHGLATAYYLAKEHGITNVAVLEKSSIGLGNTGRNTTIIRSNYLWDESARLYEKSLQLFESLTQDINYNLMLSQRGVINLAHTLHDLRELERRVNAIRLNGVDSEILTVPEIKRMVPILNTRRTPAIRCWARRCSGAAASPATTRRRGVWRGRRTRAAST